MSQCPKSRWLERCSWTLSSSFADVRSIELAILVGTRTWATRFVGRAGESCICRGDKRVFDDGASGVDFDDLGAEIDLRKLENGDGESCFDFDVHEPKPKRRILVWGDVLGIFFDKVESFIPPNRDGRSVELKLETEQPKSTGNSLVETGVDVVEVEAAIVKVEGHDGRSRGRESCLRQGQLVSYARCPEKEIRTFGSTYWPWNQTA